MIDKNKLVEYLKNAKVKHYYTSDSKRHRFHGTLPDDVKIASMDENTFLSEKNTQKWIDFINGKEAPKKPEAPKAEPKVGQEIIANISDAISTNAVLTEDIDFDAMSKRELETYTLEKYGVDLNLRYSKDKLIAQINELANGE